MPSLFSTELRDCDAPTTRRGLFCGVDFGGFRAALLAVHQRCERRFSPQSLVPGQVLSLIALAAA
jgi:hypothetical protein